MTHYTQGQQADVNRALATLDRLATAAESLVEVIGLLTESLTPPIAVGDGEQSEAPPLTQADRLMLETTWDTGYRAGITSTKTDGVPMPNPYRYHP